MDTAHVIYLVAKILAVIGFVIVMMIFTPKARHDWGVAFPRIVFGILTIAAAAGCMVLGMAVQG